MSYHPLTPSEDFSHWLLVELFRAYHLARKCKRGTVDEQLFEMNAVENLVALRDSILGGYYHPSKGIAFIVHKPVMREIFAAPFRDRIVHHFIYNIVADWWDTRFIYDSYSCRVGKGTWFGIRRLAHHMRSVSDNYTIPTYVIKLDIQGYFMSLPRKKLYERALWGLDRQFPDHGRIYNIVKYLWREVIFDDPTPGVVRKGGPAAWEGLPRSKSLFCQPYGQGIVIGNLSSQLLSNIYLDQLDRFVTMTLGYKAYGRYVDDFFYVVPESRYDRARLDVKRIERFLYFDLGLTLHPKKRSFRDIFDGVNFLGSVVYPHHIVAAPRISGAFRSAAFQVSAGEADPDLIVSYLGILKNLNGKKLASRIFEDVGWEYNL